MCVFTFRIRKIIVITIIFRVLNVNTHIDKMHCVFLFGVSRIRAFVHPLSVYINVAYIIILLSYILIHYNCEASICILFRDRAYKDI